MSAIQFTLPGVSHMTTVVKLMQRGLTIASAIDAGCADGDFLLFPKGMGIIGDAACLNVDANPIYERSLREIEVVTGTKFHIGPLAAMGGDVTITHGGHIYWDSVRAPEDSYWKESGVAPHSGSIVRAATLDELVRDVGLKGPFLLKLDVQGGELSVLSGATQVLKETALLVVEINRPDVRDVDRFIEKSGFNLFDVTDIGRNSAGNFAWFFCTYLERSLMDRFGAPLWTGDETPKILVHQEKHRAGRLQRNAQLLDLIRGRK
ncbi:MAG: FkbM family methyltransferase [Rhodospirillaceae bacterium]|nr:FkbM family methyltransferase [Rhodospirillaceae bacterium]